MEGKQKISTEMMPMKTESKRIFLDTNVLIYQTFEDFDEEKHQYVCRVLQYLAENSYEIYLSSQVLREYLPFQPTGKFLKNH